MTDPLERQEQLADELRARVGAFDLASCDTIDKIDAAERWLVERMAAMNAERADELAYPVAERDTEWLASAKPILRVAGGHLNNLRQRRSRLEKAHRRAEHDTQELRQFAAFKEIVQSSLGRQRYLALWEEVYRQYPLLRLRDHPLAVQSPTPESAHG